ncbi:hydroxymethylglutaryl-CoA synthase family protein [Flavobacterium sp. MK4S-17]|uniref:hydroxymethylglutaryl-CoA synthase family protein n=1 Tax=Flavobacterium sp. MK4S-17 TaxID=2543737 RepID=UPI00135BBF31|nr:hydroxymethylglutaryl-CoA synthase [Flavobacterium sp. MK4S-17]
MNTGIDAIAFDVAKLHLPIKTLAKARNIDTEKLEKGLGLLNITVPDVNQDAVVFAANALTKLINGNIKPADISRIYVGTESGVDNAKPIGSYLVGLMEQLYGEGSFSHCDAVDFTFACIGAVDALQNCLDYIRLNPDKKAIVISTDIARYDLGSTGEYTQGAGALAMLVSANPKIIALDTNWAVSTKGVFDFFKPYRTISKRQITGNENNEPWLGQLESEIELHKDQPVFDGQYSNQCYMERTKQAYFRFKEMVREQGSLYNRWEALVMHLPYAYQGRRMFSEIFALDANPPLLNENEPAEDYQLKVKEVSKSEAYKDFVKAKLESAERASSLVGNVYTGSVFMGLLCTLVQLAGNRKTLTGKKIGFLAYGSGSKSKVFEGTLQQGWADAVKSAPLFETLQQSHEIDFDTYLKLHKREKHSPVLKPKEEWVLERIEKEKPNLTGARYYKWVE